MSKQQKMTALKPFIFRGEMLAAEDELVPDNKEQGDLLITLGLAARSRRGYLNRAIKPSASVVMTTEV